MLSERRPAQRDQARMRSEGGRRRLDGPSLEAAADVGLAIGEDAADRLVVRLRLRWHRLTCTAVEPGRDEPSLSVALLPGPSGQGVEKLAAPALLVRHGSCEQIRGVSRGKGVVAAPSRASSRIAAGTV